MTVYASAMSHPVLLTAFSPNSATPNVCFACRTESCGENGVLDYGPPDDFTGAIQQGARCAELAAHQVGSPTRERVAVLEESLQLAEEYRVAALLRADAAQEELAALKASVLKPYLDELLSSHEKAVKVAALAGANVVRKANGAAS